MKKFLHKTLLCLTLILPATGLEAVDWGDDGTVNPWGTALKDVESASGAFYMTLGPTGVRAKYIDGSRNTMIVMYVFPGSPADGKLQVGDVITGVNGQGFLTSAIKSGEEGNDGGYGGPFKEFGEAIEEAQDSDGVIPVTVLRQASTINYDIIINVTGTFSSTYPYNCPKSVATYPKLIDYVESDMDTEDFKWNSCTSEGNFYCAMAMISSTDPSHFATQTGIAHRYADTTYATLQASEEGNKVWVYSFASMYLCEYYLRYKDDETKDVEWVKAEIEQIRDWLYDARYQRQNNTHFLTEDGWGHRHWQHLGGYGAFMYPTPMVIMQFGLMNRCGITIDREYIDGPMAGIRNATNDTGGVWYHSNTAKPSGITGDRARPSMAAMANYFATTHDTKYVDYAKLHAGINTVHTGPNFGYYSGHGSSITHMFAIGMGQRLNPQLQRRTLDEFKTWYALSETHDDGQFVTQPTRGNTKSGVRGRAVGSALFALLLSQPSKSLHIYGAGGGNGEPEAFNVPVITGNPSLSISEGGSYNFAPSAYDLDGDSLTYSITNKPAWAKFNPLTGELSGTPNNAQSGDYSNIIISVNDGFYTSNLSPFTITVLDVSVTTNNKVKVFIIAGQSNMQGKGTKENKSTTNWNGILETLLVTEPAKYGHLVNNGDVDDLIARTDVSMAYKREVQDPAIKSGALNASFGTNNNVIGPELGMGEQIGNALDEKVLIIKCAWGGKSINVDFRPPSAPGGAGVFYTHMVNDVNAILNNIATHVPGYTGEGYEIAGFAWWQGWNNATSVNLTTKKDYEDLMVMLGNDVRDSFNTPNMPIVIASSGNGGFDPNMPGTCTYLKENIEPAQQAAALRLSNASYYSTRDLWNDAVTQAPYEDWSHWNYSFASYYDVGTRMGENFVQLLANGGSGSINQSPFISGEPATYFLPDSVTTYNFTPTATDADNDSLIFSIEGKPSWATFNTLTGELNGVPTPVDAGITPITITVSDGQFSTSISFDLDISGASAGDVINFADLATDGVLPNGNSGWGNDHTITGTDTLAMTGKNNLRLPIPVTVTANTILEFDFESTDEGQYHWIGFRDATTNTTHFFMLYGYKGTRPQDFDVTKRYEGPGTEHFRIEIGESIPLGDYTEMIFAQTNKATMNSTYSRVAVYEFDQSDNQPPTLTNSPTSTFEADGISVYSYTPTGTDYELDPLTFSTTNVPSWATYDAATGGFEGTPTASDVGVYPITVTVSDGLLTTELQTTITITVEGGQVNQAPLIAGTPNTSFEASGATYNFTPISSDPDGDTLTFSITGKPTWATFSTSTGAISGVPGASDAGSSSITITVSDGELTADLSYDLTVTAPTQTVLNFNDYLVNGSLPEVSARDGTATISGTNNNTLTLSGFKSAKLTLPTTITSTTYLEFDVNITSFGRYVQIGFYNGNTKEQFHVTGTKKARSIDYALNPEYVGPGTIHYKIKLSDYMALTSYEGLYFQSYAPNTNSANVVFSNVKVYEDTQ